MDTFTLFFSFLLVSPLCDSRPPIATFDSMFKDASILKRGRSKGGPVLKPMPKNVYQLDIVLTDEQLEEVKKQEAKQELLRKRRKAIEFTYYRWPNKIIPYKINSSFTEDERSQILEAMQHWSNKTCLRFRPKLQDDQFYIQFRGDSVGCWSGIGIGWPQTINLAPGCRVARAIIHEIGHSVGWFHEQSRPDRDDYVSIVTENIQPGKERNFLINDKINTYDVAYDYLSMMHYGSYFFTKDYESQLKTIVTKDPKFQDKIGRATVLSDLDVEMANKMYDCEGIWGEWSGWTSCTSSCDGGEQTRTRTCTTAGVTCTGESTEIRSCNIHPCIKQATETICPSGSAMGPFSVACLVDWWLSSGCTEEGTAYPPKNTDRYKGSTVTDVVILFNKIRYKSFQQSENDAMMCFGESPTNSCKRYSLGPHKRLCLALWWLYAGCSFSGSGSPSRDKVRVAAWNTVSSELVMSEMKSFRKGAFRGKPAQMEICFGESYPSTVCAKTTDQGPYKVMCLLKWWLQSCRIKGRHAPNTFIEDHTYYNSLSSTDVKEAFQKYRQWSLEGRSDADGVSYKTLCYGPGFGVKVN